VKIPDRLGRAPAKRNQVVVIGLGSAHAARLAFVAMSISLAR
jgi:predicted tellurium resistance membrane protein TerC